jgi:hypothetical protein
MLAVPEAGDMEPYQIDQLYKTDNIGFKILF